MINLFAGALSSYYPEQDHMVALKDTLPP